MIKRLYVEKKEGYNVAEKKLFNDISQVLGVSISDAKIFIRYDIQGLSDEAIDASKNTIFSENPVDTIYDGNLPELKGYKLLVVEYLAGQYDQRADSAMQCVQLLTMGARPIIKCATVYAFKDCSENDFTAIKQYIINPVESKEGSMEMPETLDSITGEVKEVPVIEGFIDMGDKEISDYHSKIGFAMSEEDLKFVRDYFISEKRNPTETELKVIDTYWSDHC
ncbi:MAG: phosphoribosylformylglycinamidine synthase, partial [Clostridia bacterium]|nr:phosphoribosylformylglycinamidine synthase [Clostridia bacterium]